MRIECAPSRVFHVDLPRILSAITAVTATASTEPTGPFPRQKKKEDQESHGQKSDESEDGEEHEDELPMLADPEDESCVLSVPTAFPAVVEEGCCDLAS